MHSGHALSCCCASPSGEEVFFRPPYHNLRHPLIFYYGHTAVVYVNKMRVAGLLTEPVNAYFESVFETGVDEMSWDDLSKNDMMWPSVREVKSQTMNAVLLLLDVFAWAINYRQDAHDGVGGGAAGH